MDIIPFDIKKIVDRMEKDLLALTDPSVRINLRQLAGATLNPVEIPPVAQVENVIISRQKIHGDFADNARLTQTLKRLVYDEPGSNQLDDTQAQALELILLKLSRIISGNPDEPDHWCDIAGYAALVMNHVQRKNYA